MQADLTRDTFEPLRHFSRVLMQQGRVTLDADWNEQVAILLHLLRTLTVDLVGPHAAPRDADGNDSGAFRITAGSDRDVRVGPGHYYVNGLLCECTGDEKAPVTYRRQPYWPRPTELTRNGTYLFFLVAWERHVTWIGREGIREVALGGADTCSRAEVVWQVQALRLPSQERGTNDPSALLSAAFNRPRGAMAARAFQPKAPTDPCDIDPEARYRGPENQLYRIEIHEGGPAAEGGPRRAERVLAAERRLTRGPATERRLTRGPAAEGGRREQPEGDARRVPEAEPERADDAPERATFKWSRDNASVVYPVADVQGDTVVLDSLGRDDRTAVRVGDIVEVVDDDLDLSREVAPLREVVDVDAVNFRVVLDAAPEGGYGSDPARRPFLRRWDHRPRADQRLVDRAVPLVEGEWIAVEDGVEIRFEPGGTYRSGDYWLVPARTATGDVEWPGPAHDPDSRPPHGVAYHVAPLALATRSGQGNFGNFRDLRRLIERLSAPAPTS